MADVIIYIYCVLSIFVFLCSPPFSRKFEFIPKQKKGLSTFFPAYMRSGAISHVAYLIPPNEGGDIISSFQKLDGFPQFILANPFVPRFALR